MIILITQGGGVQNWTKVDCVICAHSITYFLVTVVGYEIFCYQIGINQTKPNFSELGTAQPKLVFYVFLSLKYRLVDTRI